MMIKDLEMHKDLAAAELSAVRGGSNSISNGSLIAPVAALNGPSVGSPQTIVSAPTYAPTNVLQDNDTNVHLDTSTTNVVGSAFTGVVQGFGDPRRVVLF
jgi:hypothetical protein